VEGIIKHCKFTLTSYSEKRKRKWKTAPFTKYLEHKPVFCTVSLKVENISFGYTNDNLILEDISFCVDKGETFCILGASGSGKSTLLKVIAQILPNSRKNVCSGSVTFNSESIDKLKQAGRLSYMFQEPALLPNLTVRGNIELPTRILQKSFQHSVQDTIRTVGLNASIEKYPRDLSGGMRTRTAMARSFITQPSVLLLDEAFSSLDVGWQNSLYKELKTLQKRDNTAVVLVTHNVDEAVELADKILILSHRGTVLQQYDLRNADVEYVRKAAKEIILKDHYNHLKKQ
jgi:ABC-type nitrate/sulfonate/bicarbonate transport system ATPase subunit